MSNYYPYLIASLPFLQFGAKPPLSSEKLVALCSNLVSSSDAERIKMAYLTIDADYSTDQPTLKKWHDFETALRNELVRLRAPKRHADAVKYLRQDGHVSPHVAHIVFHASKMTSIIESEKMLDEERWRMLDELEAGHYFDLDRVIIYAYKLSLLEKWDKIHTVDKEKLLSAALQ